MVESYRYLWVVIDDGLSLKDQLDPRRSMVGSLDLLIKHQYLVPMLLNGLWFWPF